MVKDFKSFKRPENDRYLHSGNYSVNFPFGLPTFVDQDLPSLTVPSQSYTVQEIISKFAHGVPLSVERKHYYDADYDEHYPSDLDEYTRNDYADTLLSHSLIRDEVSSARKFSGANKPENDNEVALADESNSNGAVATEKISEP